MYGCCDCAGRVWGRAISCKPACPGGGLDAVDNGALSIPLWAKRSSQVLVSTLYFTKTGVLSPVGRREASRRPTCQLSSACLTGNLISGDGVDRSPRAL